MERLYFPRPMISGQGFQCCLKIVLEDGREFSLAGDNSLGRAPQSIRHEIRVYASAESCIPESEQIHPTPQALLIALADFLGYHVRPKDAFLDQYAVAPEKVMTLLAMSQGLIQEINKDTNMSRRVESMRDRLADAIVATGAEDPRKTEEEQNA